MGSYSATCSVSGLPIGPGDAVRFMLLVGTPYGDDSIETRCMMNGMYAPRALPILGCYNDYGSVEDCEDDIYQKTLLDLFQYDAVERGMGKNQCHDTAVKKKMSWEDWLEALQENRVLVRQGVNLSVFELASKLSQEKKAQQSPAKGKGKAALPTKGKAATKGKGKAAVAAKGKAATKGKPENTTREIPKGLPTRKRVEDALGKLAPNCHVRKIRYGEVQVRAAGYGAEMPILKKAMAGLRNAGFALVLRAQPDEISGYPEIRVLPLPGTNTHKFFDDGPKAHLERPLPVRVAMIREDVWQLLLDGKGMAAYQKDAESLVKKLQACAKKKVSAVGELSRFADLLMDTDQNRVRPWVFSMHSGNSGYPCVMGVTEQLKIMATRGDFPKDLAQRLAEFALVSRKLMELRYQWRPLSTSGPQYQDHDDHAAWFGGLAKIALQRVKEEQKQREKDGL